MHVEEGSQLSLSSTNNEYEKNMNLSAVTMKIEPKKQPEGAGIMAMVTAKLLQDVNPETINKIVQLLYI